MKAPVAVLGRAGEAPVALLLAALERMRRPPLVLDPHDPLRPALDWGLRVDGRLDGVVRCGRRCLALASLAGLYLRPPDPARVPAAQAWIQSWVEAAELAEFIVVNRISVMVSNGSKPLQSRLLAAVGFAVPAMLMARDPAAVLAFEAEHGALIYKSASGARSIVQPLDDSARRRLPLVRHVPTLFQQRLQGTNLRVHVVGDEIFATEVDSPALDYRYAGHSAGGGTTLRATQLSADTEALCRRAARELALPFVGLDLMLAADGRTYCFEANPSPGYSWYENATGQGIAAALARLLCGVAA